MNLPLRLFLSSDLFTKLKLLLIAFLFIGSLKGQSVFHPGYIITNQNDTIQGLIDFRGEVRNAKKCYFKKKSTDDAQEYSPFMIKGYRFVDGKYYVSRTIKDNDGKEVQVFLEFLLNGIDDLYFYAEPAINHYYIEKSDGQLIELTNERNLVSIDGKDYYKESKKYIGLLRYVFGDCPQIYPLINKAKLEDKSLIEITKKYHDYMCEGEKCIIYEKKLPVIRFRFSPLVGWDISFLKLRNNPEYKKINFRMAGSASGGLIMNTSMPRVNEKMSFQGSISFTKNYFYGTSDLAVNSEFQEVYLHSSFLKLTGGAKYTYPKGTWRPTLLIGGNYIQTMKTDGRRIIETNYNSTIYSNEYTDFKIAKILVGLNVEVGMDYRISESRIVFLSLGLNNSTGKEDFLLADSYLTNLKSIQLHAGIYF